MRQLISNQLRFGKRLEVHAMNAIGQRLYEYNFNRPQFTSREAIQQIIEQASDGVAEHKFSPHSLTMDWKHVDDAWQVETWEAYRDNKRLGRKKSVCRKNLPW